MSNPYAQEEEHQRAISYIHNLTLFAQASVLVYGLPTVDYLQPQVNASVIVTFGRSDVTTMKAFAWAICSLEHVALHDVAVEQLPGRDMVERILRGSDVSSSNVNLEVESFHEAAIDDHFEAAMNVLDAIVSRFHNHPPHVALSIFLSHILTDIASVLCSREMPDATFRSTGYRYEATK